MPWFVGRDVADALGYAKPQNAIATHVDPEDALKRGILTNGGEQEMIIINESGVYALIFGSKLESARKFKHWVTSEVLPAIRKNGFFGELSPEYRLQCAEILSKTPIKRMKFVGKTLGFDFTDEFAQIDEAKEIAQAKAIKQIVNTVKFFLDSLVEPIPEFTPTKFVFDNYVKWCGSNNTKPISRVEFSRKLTKLLNRPIINKKVNGEKARVLV